MHAVKHAIEVIKLWYLGFVLASGESRIRHDRSNGSNLPVFSPRNLHQRRSLDILLGAYQEARPIPWGPNVIFNFQACSPGRGQLANQSIVELYAIVKVANPNALVFSVGAVIILVEEHA